MTVHLRKHEAVQDCGSFEVWFDDARPSKFFYFDDLPNRRLRADLMMRKQALEAAQAFARESRDSQFSYPILFGLSSTSCA